MPMSPSMPPDGRIPTRSPAPGGSSRDPVHAAVMLRLEVEQVVSADTDFDRLPGVARLDPMLVGEWGSSLRG